MVLPIRGKRRALLFLSYYLVHRSFHNWTVYELLSGHRLLCWSALSFFAADSVALVLRSECPRFRGRAKEHLRNFHPVAAITAC